VPSKADEFNIVLDQLKDHVGFRQRRGDSTYDLARALIGHRAQCLLNLLDEEDDTWKRRVEVLDRIAEAHGISVDGQDSLHDVLKVLSERDRQRRSDEVARHLWDPDEVHGPLMSPEAVTHGLMHLRRYFGSGESSEQRDAAELEAAKRPAECVCGFEYVDADLVSR